MSAYVPASHIYTGSAQCGCVVAMCVDQPEYAHDIDEFRNLGYVVTRIETAKQAWTRCEAHKDLNDEAWLVAVDAVLHAARTGRPCFEDAALMSAELAAARATVDALRAERDEAVALLGEVRSGVIFRDTPKNDDLANRIDAIVARRKA